ncbi:MULTISPECIES: isochorismatase family protein [unclassified Amycolatopsis]|uniref:cysteine hydrolase family protein n=1 Tax=unclassified Amycolatopsis TaxID=2618356 RepID=UPI002875DBAE|nr:MULTISPECIES: isochorismatase family protein [unclassified Amycolatopsis]MDS0133909.1 isochorismatase family protein [Amycolatopsis sp. 505]MDS0144785.1 isochorismatase family protein [Amycolatopsis sp. CM201R]
MRRILAVIDLQNVFADSASPWFTPRFAEVVPRIHRLVTAFGDDVVFTRFVAPSRPEGAWRRYYEQWPFALQAPGSPLYQVIDAFEPKSTVDATTFGKWNARMATRVGGAGLVLAGVSTDCCVLSTALAAADAGVAVTVVSDACAGVDDESHAKALDILRLYAPLVTVATVAEVLD